MQGYAWQLISNDVVVQMKDKRDYPNFLTARSGLAGVWGQEPHRSHAF